MTIATLIIDVLANTAQIHGDVDKINTKLDSIGGAAEKVTGYVTKAFSIGAVTAFAQEIIDTASEIHDMASAVGVSAEAIQRYKFAAEQTGATMDDVARAINYMNKQLAGGDNSTRDALDKAHLSFETLRAMKPEDAFNAITEAVRLIPDPILQSKVAAELFSKSALALLPGIKEGFDQIGRSASVMSNETIQEYDDIGDAISRVKQQVVVYTAEFMRSGVGLNDYLRWLKASYEFVTRAGSAANALPPTPSIFTPSGAAAIKVSNDELERANRALDAQRDALDSAAKAHATFIKGIRDDLSGAKAVQGARDMIEALRGSIPVMQMSADAQKRINSTMLDAIEVFQRQGRIAPQAMRDLYIATIPLPPMLESMAVAIAHIGDQAKLAMPVLVDLPKPIDDTTAAIKLLEAHAIKSSLTLKDLLPDAVKQSRVSIDDLARSISQLSQISGGAFSGIAQSIGTMVGALDTALKGIDKIKSVDWQKGGTWQGILSTTTGIMGIVSAAITATKAIFDLFNNHHGRDLVIDFADNLGGFDALHASLLQGGAAGEALWIKLTQGVGKNNPEQAKQVIAEVQRFLDALGNTKVSPEIDVQVSYPDNMPSEPPDNSPGYASGTPGLGFVNFGARKPIWAHGDEAIIPRSKVGDLAGQIAAAMGGGGGGDINITLDAGDLGKQMVKIARKDAATGGLRTRVTAGRSY
jgi:hypothetical protein